MELVMKVCKQCKRRFYRPPGAVIPEEFCSFACEADHKAIQEKKQ